MIITKQQIHKKNPTSWVFKLMEYTLIISSNYLLAYLINNLFQCVLVMLYLELDSTRFVRPLRRFVRPIALRYTSYESVNRTRRHLGDCRPPSRHITIDNLHTSCHAIRQRDYAQETRLFRNFRGSTTRNKRCADGRKGAVNVKLEESLGRKAG